ncbi:uncharacterized protein LOC135397597 [Ornithodoros turicata]|uniref:uncharacterized protein LOC135397597 n=1 Tax=Ornithodoros turicata TaxID=34597 RepID=UPI003139A662
MDPIKQDEIKRIARQISNQSLQLKGIVDSLLQKRGSASRSEEADDDYETQISTTTHFSRGGRPITPQRVMIQDDYDQVAPPPQPPRQKSRDQIVAEQRSRHNLGDYFKRLATQMDLLADSLKPEPPTAAAPMPGILLSQEPQDAVGYLPSGPVNVVSPAMPPVMQIQAQASHERLAQAMAAQTRAMQAQAIAAQAIASQGIGAAPQVTPGMMPPGMMPPGMMPPGMMGPGMMGPGMMGPGMMGPGMMGQGMMGSGTMCPGMMGQGMMGPGMMGPGMMGPGMMGPGMMGPGMMGPGMMGPGMMGPGMMGPGMMGPGMVRPSGGEPEAARKSSSETRNRTKPLYSGISKLTDDMQVVSGLFKEALGVVPAETRLTTAEQEEIRFCLDRLTRNMENMTNDLRQTMLTTTGGAPAAKDEKKDKEKEGKKKGDSEKDFESEEDAGGKRGGKKGGKGGRDEEEEEDY